MAIGNPLLPFLWRDLLGLGEISFTLLVFLFLPALVITLVSARRARPVSWRTIGLGFVRAWVTAIAACMVFGLTLTGVIKLARQMITTEYAPMSEWNWFLICALSLVFGVWFAYRNVAAYFAVQQPAETAVTQTVESKGKPRRWAFFVRTFLVAQLLLFGACGLWYASRRPDLLRISQWQAEEAEFRQYMQRIDARYSPYGWRVTARQFKPHKMKLLAEAGPLTNFNDDVLDAIAPADELALLQIRSDALSDAGLTKLAKQPLLEELLIESNQITDGGLVALQQVPKLRALDISGERLTPLALQHLQFIKTLRELRMALADPSSTEAAAFRVARPDVKLELVNLRPSVGSP